MLLVVFFLALGIICLIGAIWAALGISDEDKTESFRAFWLMVIFFVCGIFFIGWAGYESAIGNPASLPEKRIVVVEEILTTKNNESILVLVTFSTNIDELPSYYEIPKKNIPENVNITKGDKIVSDGEKIRKV